MTTTATSTFRIATLNVHGWHNEEPEAWDGLIDLLGRVKPDVIALQEATKHRVPPLAAALGGYHWIARTNCAILSRHPLVAAGPGHVSGRGRVQAGRKRDQQRPCISACLTRHCVGRLRMADGADLEVVCVHLDHVREPRRLSELAKLGEYLDARPSVEPTSNRVMLGDFNALTRADYSAGEWAAVADVRARNAWEAPVSAVTGAMTQAVAAKRASGHSSGAAYRMVDARQAARSVAGPLSTCRFDTRIDYVFLSPAIAHMNVAARHAASDEQQQVAAAAIAYECHACIPRISDHNLVVATLELSQGCP